MNGNPLEIVNEYTYLGVTLQTALEFNKQIKRVTAKATAAIGRMSSHLSKLSFAKALQVFEGQVKPVVTYGLAIYAPCLSSDSLEKLDRVKTAFLRKALQLPKSSSVERTHNICGERRLCEDLRAKGYNFGEETWTRYSDHLELNRQRAPECNNIAWYNSRWMESDQPRHFVVGYAVTGFHQFLCPTKEFHSSDSQGCKCRLCGSNLSMDHIDSCIELGDKPLHDKYLIVTGKTIA